MFFQGEEGSMEVVWGGRERPGPSSGLALGQPWFILPSHGWRDLGRIVEGRLWSHSVTSLALVPPLTLLGSSGPKSHAVSGLAEQWCRVFSGSSPLDMASSIVSVSLYPLWSCLASEAHRAWRSKGLGNLARPAELLWTVALRGGRKGCICSHTIPFSVFFLYFTNL